jgi:small multidrug resistance family-3 protein
VLGHSQFTTLTLPRLCERGRQWPSMLVGVTVGRGPRTLSKSAMSSDSDAGLLGLACRMTIVRSVLLFVVAALAEIGGAWLVWQGVRESKGLAWIGAGVLALGIYGFVATLQPDPNFGRILAAYGGIFVAGSLAWGMIVDGFRPDRYDIAGSAICLLGVAVIMYAPRGSSL